MRNALNLVDEHVVGRAEAEILDRSHHLVDAHRQSFACARRRSENHHCDDDLIAFVRTDAAGRMIHGVLLWREASFGHDRGDNRVSLASRRVSTTAT